MAGAFGNHWFILGAIDGRAVCLFRRDACETFDLGLNPNHFQAWLQLWEFNCRTYLKSDEAQEMIDLAHEIGRRLKRIIGVTDFKI